MKTAVIATDLHGSAFYGKAVIDAFYREKAEGLILLGDIYYHGPRNPIPNGHAPMELAQALNEIKDKLTVIRGNCDAEIDLAISEFAFYTPQLIDVGNMKLFCMHGHEDVVVPNEAQAVIYGHYHVNDVKFSDGKVRINVASVSLPKNGAERSYLVAADGKLVLKRLSDGSTIEEVKIF